MKTVLYKFYANFEAEEDWLNRMSQRGLALIDFTFCKYTFEDCEKGEYIYRIELLERLATHPESREYIAFMESSGIECVATYMRWVIFRKKASEGAFDIFTDIDSRLTHYRRVCQMWAALFCMELSIGIYNILISLMPRNAIGVINLLCGMLLLSMAWMFSQMLWPMRRRVRQLERERRVRE